MTRPTAASVQLPGLAQAGGVRNVDSADAAVLQRRYAHAHPREVTVARLLSVAPSSSEPIYLQLVRQVRRLVSGGQLTAGDVLPSVRCLARALEVNPMTVSKAFSLLAAEGLLTRRRGLAMTIAERCEHGPDIPRNIDLLRPTLERAAREVLELRLPPGRALTLFKQILSERQSD